MIYKNPLSLEMLQRHARGTSGHVALAAGDDRLTYHELAAFVERGAAALSSRGIAQGQPVAVLMTGARDFFASLVTVICSGACVVPIEPTDPPVRVRSMLAAIRPALVLCDSRTAALVGEHPAWEIASSLPEPVVMPAAISATPRDLADLPSYICFTSGSSGSPKGVVVPRRALTHAVRTLSEYLGLGLRPREHVLTTSWAFDIAIADTCLAISSGGTLVVPQRDLLRGRSLASVLAALTDPVVQGTPSRFATIPSDALESLPATTTLILGGESANDALLMRLGERANVHVAYGVTEAGICSMIRPVIPGKSEVAASIGYPLPDVRCVVEDDAGCAVPPGVTGQLSIAGPGLADGYFENVQATVDRFQNDATGSRWYRTGDLVQQVGDGSIVFVGRADEQLNVLGYRVEPAEVEHALRGCAGVEQAAVIVEATSEIPALVGFVSGAGVDVADVRLELAARLPTWMVPQRLEKLERLPMTTTGKVDRQALTQREEVPGGGSAAHESRTDSLATMTDIWKEVLGLEAVAPEDDFFALGGHSVKVMQVVVRARRRLGCDVEMDDLFDTPVLKDLVARLFPAGGAVDGRDDV